MTQLKKQAIAGVSAGTSTLVHFVYPSIAAITPGQWIGWLCDCIPVRINGVKLSTIIFALPLSPFATMFYVLGKVIGERYVITTTHVQKWKMLLAVQSRLLGEVPLEQIDQIVIEELPGQAFYHAADVVLLDSSENELLRLEGVARPDVFSQNILESRDAKVHTSEAMAAIAARG